jgi:hypothetical protein
MAGANHLEVLVEEPSMEAFLRALLPRVVPAGRSFEIHPFQGKDDLLGKLEARLRAYAKWLPADWKVMVIVDRDDEDCGALKRRMEDIWHRTGLVSRTRARAARAIQGQARWQLVNRIAIEELEAWYFGDWQGVRAAYPGVPETVTQRRGMRDPDAIAGGTWEAFERVLQKHGYFKAGLAKIEAARTLGQTLAPERNRSTSFAAFRDALSEVFA